MNMGMFVLYVALVAAGAAIVAYFVLRSRTNRVSKKTLVVCPPNQITAELDLDKAGNLMACTRLPVGHTCDQVCMRQAEYSVASLEEFTEKFVGRNCESCGSQINAEDWYKSRLVQVTNEKADGRPMRGANEGHALCWNCFSGTKAQASGAAKQD